MVKAGTLRKYPISGIDRLRMGKDGKGICTLILMSGCPLKCKYCINPYTWNEKKNPKLLSVYEIYDRVRIDRPYFIATGGGLTFGGGEPLLYPELINEIRQVCDPEMTINVETSLNVEWQAIEETIASIDKFYIDVKTMSHDLYKDYTGGELERVLENLRRLIQRKPIDDIVVRIPCIRGYVDEKSRAESLNQLKQMGIKQFDLFSYKVDIDR